MNLILERGSKGKIRHEKKLFDVMKMRLLALAFQTNNPAFIVTKDVLSGKLLCAIGMDIYYGQETRIIYDLKIKRSLKLRNMPTSRLQFISISFKNDGSTFLNVIENLKSSSPKCNRY